jgi:hypothetical protein
MSARQDEFRQTMIKRRGLPDVRCVTRLAVVTELRRDVAGIRWFRKIRRMTRVTISVHQFVVAIYVARLTRRRDVCTCKGELR